MKDPHKYGWKPSIMYIPIIIKKQITYFLISINNSSTIKKGQWIKISKLKKLVDLYVVGFEVIKEG